MRQRFGDSKKGSVIVPIKGSIRVPIKRSIRVPYMRAVVLPTVTPGIPAFEEHGVIWRHCLQHDSILGAWGLWDLRFEALDFQI